MGKEFNPPRIFSVLKNGRRTIQYGHRVWLPTRDNASKNVTEKLNSHPIKFC